jgi:hypothetical protein
MLEPHTTPITRGKGDEPVAMRGTHAIDEPLADSAPAPDS